MRRVPYYTIAVWTWREEKYTKCWKAQEISGETGGFSRETVKELHKNFTKILCKLFIPPLANCGAPCYTISWNPREKGGIWMMKWTWLDQDDVDDLIFTDSGWMHSER